MHAAHSYADSWLDRVQRGHLRMVAAAAIWALEWGNKRHQVCMGASYKVAVWQGQRRVAVAGELRRVAGLPAIL